MRALRARFWTESVLGAVFLIIGVATLINQEWVEFLFGVDPDGGNGALEWAFVAMFGFSAVCAFLARREWRRHAVSA